MVVSYPLVYIIILTHNNCVDTVETITSLYKMVYSNFQIVVVDNHSTDETIEILKRKYSDIHILVNADNLGFATGVNVGIHYAIQQKAEFILLLNNDVVVDAMMLTYLVDAMTASNIGASAPLIYYFDDPRRIWSDGFRKSRLTLELREGRRGQLDNHTREQSSYDMDYLLGCALLIQSEVFKKIGFFDERYFFYYEDLDFCLRAKQSGYRLVTVPKAKMWHKVSGTAGIGSEFRTYHMARSSVIFFRIHAKGLQRGIVFFFRFGSAFKKSLSFLVNKQIVHLRYYWQGLWDGWLVS